MPILLPAIGLIVLVAIIGYLTKGRSKPITGRDVTHRVTGTIVRSGCAGCANRHRLRTQDVYCGWDGNNLVVHLEFVNPSSRALTVYWYPAVLLADGTFHGTGAAFLQKTEIGAGGVREVFNQQLATGSSAGASIANCYPSFESVRAE